VREHRLSSSGQPPSDARATAAVAVLGESFLSGVPAPLILAGLTTWLEIFGAVSFELFGQLNTVVTDRDAFFEHVVRAMAAMLGLPQVVYVTGRRTTKRVSPGVDSTEISP
jgi:hypothetical protein